MPSQPNRPRESVGLLVAACVVVALGAPPPARAADVIDQQNMGPTTTSQSIWLNTLGQTFTPGFNTVDFADVLVACCDLNNPGPGTIRMDLRSGGIAGPVIASSSVVVLPHLSGAVLERFGFTPTIALTPGATYALEAIYVSGGNSFVKSFGNTYPGGQSFYNGAGTSGDWRFQTGIYSDEPPQAGGGAVPVEYSNRFDERALPGGGEGPLDPGQVLYTEPPDDAANAMPSDTTDFAPGIEAGSEPDFQVDALAHGFDYLYSEVVANSADLVMSFEGDLISGAPLPEVAALREGIKGYRSTLYTQSDLDTSDAPGVVEDVDGLELWGPLGADDAFYYSLENDALSGTSVYVSIGGVPGIFVTHAQIFAAVTALGFNGVAEDVDLDALMVRNVGEQVEFELGDEILFSIRAVPQANFDGGEIIRLPIGGTPSFLDHGGHLWDTAFPVAAAFGSSSEDVDGLEAYPAIPKVPALPIWGVAALALVLAASAGLAGRRRATPPGG